MDSVDQLKGETFKLRLDTFWAVGEGDLCVPSGYGGRIGRCCNRAVDPWMGGGGGVDGESKLKNDESKSQTVNLKAVLNLDSSFLMILSSSFHRLDMTLAVAEALNPNKPNGF